MTKKKAPTKAKTTKPKPTKQTKSKSTKKKASKPKAPAAKAKVKEEKAMNKHVAEGESKTKAESEAAPPKKRGRPPGSKNKPKEPAPPPDQPELLKGKNVQNVALSSIDLDDKIFQFRGDNLRVDSLVESLKAHGQQIPVTLREHPEADDSGKKYQIISGFRRIEATKQIGWTKVAAIVRDDLEDEQEAFKASIIENEARKTYNDLDRGRAIVAYRQRGYLVKDLEELFGLKKRQLGRLRSLTEFPKELQDAIDEEQLTATQALILNTAKTTYGDLFDLSEWIEVIGDEELSVRDLKKAIHSQFEAQLKADKPFELFVATEAENEQGETVTRYLLPRRYIDDPKTMDESDKEAYREELERLLALFE